MHPHVSLITLAVADLERALRFYRDGLGWPTPGIIGTEFEHGAVVFFDLAGGLKLSLWPRDSLAFESGLPPGDPARPTFTLGHNVASEAEVDAVLTQAAAAGGTILKPAAKTFWGGYAAYVQDPDGHLWEIAFNPAMVAGDGVV